ncbi:hypothetical protein BDZ97DRAFT_214156, partial [Flammula alnicola]
AAPLAPPVAAEPKKPTIDITKWPKMDLATFCHQFEVPDMLQDKLAKLGVQGPHVLRWMKDEDLRGEGGLLLAL